MRYKIIELGKGNKRVCVVEAHELSNAKAAYDIWVEGIPKDVVGYELYDSLNGIILESFQFM